MKNCFLTITILLGLFAPSCKENKMNDNQDTSRKENTLSNTDEIIKSTITNKDGVKLEMSFNNTKKTATFILNGETIEMKQDLTASGIKYSNSNYEYTEHQGEMELKKDGKPIFSNKK